MIINFTLIATLKFNGPSGAALRLLNCLQCGLYVGLVIVGESVDLPSLGDCPCLAFHLCLVDLDPLGDGEGVERQLEPDIPA